MSRVIKVAGSTTTAKKTKKVKITSVTIRENRGKDMSPMWEGSDELNASQFLQHYHASMQYYNLQYSSKDLKPAVIKWMTLNDYLPLSIAAYKNTKDWRTSVTMGALASCLLKGMPSIRADFNNGRDSTDWLNASIIEVIAAGKHDDESAVAISAKVVPTVSIQERVRLATFDMTNEIEDAIESWMTNADLFDPKHFKILNLLKRKDAKASHARVIKEYYADGFAEFSVLVNGQADDDLKEGYNHRTKKQINNMFLFHKEISAACSMLMEEAKASRKPRAIKTISRDKLVEKLNFMKTHEPLKLVSINPTDIIGSKELWIFNSKTRKLGKYVADESVGSLTIKGTSIIGFNEFTSIQKTIRKPIEKLAEFKNAGKVQLRKFLDDINATDTRMNGRITGDIILLKTIA